MASFSCGGEDGSSNGTSLFVGSFNVNSEDLTLADAKAWLKRAGDADVIALGLQECAIVPANPFPEPTNGKAIGRWKDIKSHAVSDTRTDSDDVDAAAEQNSSGRSSPLMAGIAQAALAAAREANAPDNPNQADQNGGRGREPLTVTAGDEGGESPETSPSTDDSSTGDRRARFSGTQGAKSTGMRQESYYLRGVVEAERDADLLSTIAECVPGRHLVADVAMGETPTHGKIRVNVSPTRSPVDKIADGGLGPATFDDGGLDASSRSACSQSEGKSADEKEYKAVEWYGTIRLLVYVRKDLYKDLSVRTVVIPSGDKPSVVADAPEDYAKDTSPDKGAVACYVTDPSRELELLLVNCHLYGTNKYCVGEGVFDKYRMAQLLAIDSALRASLPSTALNQVVLLGDLNFRVELRGDAEDKTRGGNDFQSVVKVAEGGDPKDLLRLYNTGDRLRPLLERRESRKERGGCSLLREQASGDEAFRDGHHTNEEVPGLLSRLEDGLGAALARGQAVRPTFTYKPGDTTSFPRRYNDKRTPSWTDRILWRGFMEQDSMTNQFDAVPEVITSDHEPVYCVLSAKRTA